MRLLIVHNPSAGDGSESDEIEQVARRHGHSATLVDPSDDWSSVAERSAPDLLVIAGGDGTVKKVLTAMAEVPWTTAVLPLGTANNIARSLGLSVEDPWAEIAAWDGDRYGVPFDVAAVVAGSRDLPFVESFGGGFVAAALVSADDADEQVDDGNEHGRRHLLDVLDHAEPAGWGIEIDGRDRTGEYLAVEVMNVPTVGPILALAPSALPHDGRLDVVLVTEADREPLRRAICDVAATGDGSDPVEPERLEGIRASSIRIDPPADVSLHLDDELFESDGSPCSIEVGRRTVTMLRC